MLHSLGVCRIQGLWLFFYRLQVLFLCQQGYKLEIVQMPDFQQFCRFCFEQNCRKNVGYLLYTELQTDKLCPMQ